MVRFETRLNSDVTAAINNRAQRRFKPMLKIVGFIFIVIGELILPDAIIPENIMGTPAIGKASKLLNFEAFVMLCRTLLQKRICFFSLF